MTDRQREKDIDIVAVVQALAQTNFDYCHLQLHLMCTMVSFIDPSIY